MPGICVSNQTILFTLDEQVLNRVSLHDPVFQRDHTPSQQQHDYNPTHDCQVSRPRTANLDPKEPVEFRPFTAASAFKLPSESSLADSAAIAEPSRPEPYTGSVVEVVLISNWGDPSYIGLTGIALLEVGSQQPLKLRPDQITFSTPEGKSVSEVEVAALVDGVNLTTDAAHMWVWPMPHLPSSSCHCLTFKLDTPTSLKGLRVWNYNQSLEDSYRGVSLDHI